MGLKFKIIFGYGILIALLIVTIYIFRKEQMNRNTLHRNEKELVHTWQLTEEICIDLLEPVSYTHLTLPTKLEV